MPDDQISMREHFDVIIVGAGISGIGAAYELIAHCPDHSFVMLDAMEAFGGTWRCHTYPGVRSDSDLFTFGYRFKPWLGAPIATRDEILSYLGEVIEENDLGPHIRYRHRILAAVWNSETALWTLTVATGADDTRREFSCRFLLMCQGYYRHAQGYTPDWPGMDSFKGEIVHPQTWPAGLDCTGKDVVVIGSGATAATIVPAIAGTCRHLTMLQRSPTYFSPMRNSNPLADTLRELNVDEHWIHEIVRRRIVVDQRAFLQLSMEHPEKAISDLMKGLRKHLPQEMIDAHFTPSYRPWQQRIAVVPDGDLFRSITDGKASIVTDRIETFTPRGVRLESGTELPADIIVTATGFDLCVFGDIAFIVDGREVDFSKTITYRGMMFTGVPNLAWIMGYFRAASWTLRVDLVAQFVCRLLQNLKRRGSSQVRVSRGSEASDMQLLPWMDDGLFNPGYMARGQDSLPKRGSLPEWGHSQDYWRDREEYPLINIDAEPFVYGMPQQDMFLAEAPGSRAKP